MIREFGPALYSQVMTWPRRLILRAAEIERERQAQIRLAQFEDRAYADGMEQGREWVPDPKDPPSSSSSAHYKLDRYNARREELLRTAYPGEFTAQRERERKIAELDARWDKLERVMGGMRA